MLVCCFFLAEKEKLLLTFSISIAAKATFVTYTTHKCRRALNFTLVEQYNLKSSEACLVAPQIPSSFLALGEHEECEASAGRDEYGCFKSHLTKKGGDPLIAGETYLVVGTYIAYTSQGCHNWDVLNKPLITLWDSKAEKIKSFIKRGNKARKC